MLSLSLSHLPRPAKAPPRGVIGSSKDSLFCGVGPESSGRLHHSTHSINYTAVQALVDFHSKHDSTSMAAVDDENLRQLPLA